MLLAMYVLLEVINRLVYFFVIGQVNNVAGMNKGKSNFYIYYSYLTTMSVRKWSLSERSSRFFCVLAKILWTKVNKN